VKKGMDSTTLTTVLSLIVTIVSLIFGYIENRRANDEEGKKDIINRAFNAAAATAKNVILAAKDGKISEEEFQKIADNANAELNKIETKKDKDTATE
jgi:uncharacterized membrane protein